MVVVSNRCPFSMPCKATTTLSVKVSASFAKKYRAFCEANCLAVGKFTEAALLEIMEDHYFGLKAQRVLDFQKARPASAHPTRRL